jgi:hypothetical protein
MHESVTSKKELNCASCQERLETKENLQNHISEMHKGAFTCMTCEKNLFYKDCFRLHMYEAQCSHGNKLMKTMLKNKEVKEETSRIIWLIQIKWLFIKCKHCVEFWKVETHMKTHREVK